MRCLRLLVLAALLAAPSVGWAHGPSFGKSVPVLKGRRQLAAEVATAVWGCPMCETVRTHAPGTCPYCGMDLVRLEPAATAPVDPAAEAPNGESPAAEAPGAPKRAALMPGLPDTLFYAMALSLLGVSFALFALFDRGGPLTRGRRRNVFRVPVLGTLLRSPLVLGSARIAVLALFLLVIAAGLFGDQAPEHNLAPVLTWTIWWTWLVFAIVFFGKIWCAVCPWPTIAEAVAPKSLGLRWPKAFRNLWLATGLFVLLTWLELGYGVTGSPWLTAVLGLGMTVAVIASTAVFERRPFCRYACLVGRVSGLYSLFAASELRAADAGTCASCATKDCYRGNERGAPCPTQQFLAVMDANTYCTLCMECVKTCPHDNVAWSARPAAADLLEPKHARVDEAYLAVILLSMSAFHGLTMTPSWDRVVAGIGSALGVGSLLSFSLGMAAILALPLVVYAGVCRIMKAIANDRKHDTKTLFIRFAYSLLPIALFYHLAHNLQHFFYEGLKFVRAASDPFGWDWDVFGTAHLVITPILSVEAVWATQVILILIGHIYGIRIAHKAARSLYADARQATLTQLPLMAVMMLFSFQSLWLLNQPMLMRTAM